MESIYIMEPALQSSYMKAVSFDTMVVAANGDYRTYKGIRDLLKNGQDIKELIVLKYASQRIFSGDSRYEAYCEYKAISIPIIEVDLEEDNVAIDTSYFVGKKVLVDITGFSIPNLLRFIYVLHEIVGLHDYHMLYTEPKYYIFGKDTFGSYEYFIGEREYRALDEYYVSGENDNELLTIFLGFDRMTSSIVKEAVNPTQTVLVNGFPALTPKLKDVSLLNNRELISIVGMPEYSVKTNNPFAAYNVLRTIQDNNPNTLMNVCVLGTKAMALGAGFFALKQKSIKLSYAFTKKYAVSCSIGAGNTWYYYYHF